MFTRTGEARIVFLAGLSPDERDEIATRAERAEAIALRKAALLAGKFRDALGCTATELDRWDADGRLPHLYVRVLPFERKTHCRFWSEAQVAAAVAQVPFWRQQDRVVKDVRRQKPCLH